MSKFEKKYGPWALVTGASSGIGSEFAKQIVARKLNVVLVARREERLKSLAKQIRDQYSTDVKIVVADLTESEGIETVKRATDDLEVGLLVNNAGREDSGRFLNMPLDDALNTLDLNVRAPLQLTHHFAQKMAARDRGGIIFMSSIVAFQGVPFIANYVPISSRTLSTPFGNRFFTFSLIFPVSIITKSAPFAFRYSSFSGFLVVEITFRPRCFAS